MRTNYSILHLLARIVEILRAALFKQDELLEKGQEKKLTLLLTSPYQPSSFVLHPTCNLFQRRASKLITTITSTFTSYYVYLWPKFMVDPNPSVGINAREDENAHIAASSSEPERAVPPATTATASNTETGAGAQLYPPLPSFDGRAVCYPSMGNMRDYLAWRQADAHINNLYNTTFWNLVLKGGLTTTEAEKELAVSLFDFPLCKSFARVCVCFCIYAYYTPMTLICVMTTIRERWLHTRMRFCSRGLESIITRSQKYIRRGVVYTAK